VLDTPVGATPTRVPYTRRLTARLLAAEPLRERFMEQWSDVVRLILDRGTYLDDADIGPLVDTALPGSDEIFGALELARVIGDTATWDRIVVDTAPTGHTLRLLNLPKTFRALVRLLDAMQSKHRFMVRTLTRRYRADEADAFLTEMAGLVSALEQSLTDPSQTGALLVTNAEPIVMDETRRYLAALNELRIPVQAVVWNASDAILLEGVSEQFMVGSLDETPIGQRGLERWLRELHSALPSRKSAARAAKTPVPPASRLAPPALDGLLRPLTIVAGKGGVGKTTVAAVLALESAEHARTLVVSTDPAPSLADALRQPIPDNDTLVAGTTQLFARQMNASAAFASLREEYQSRVDALFEGLIARGVDLQHDRAIVRDLLSLAPPGVDEVYALSLLSDALFGTRYDRVVVDPAPTGHLLRLLEMPQLALAWSHQLMRLMLKYKDVTGLGNTAQELLDFSRNLRALDGLLHDARKCAAVVVTLDEPVVREESERLMRTISQRGVALSGVVTNRVGRGALPVAGAPVHFEAPLVQPPPVGVDVLRQWRSSWRPANPD
jgi:arsenite/tail-anchored protein-transporting ATPase